MRPSKRDPKVGVLLPSFDGTRSGVTPPVLEGARLIEEAGFDAAWVGDHLACPAPLLDAVTCLGAAAAVTERIELGFSVMLLGLRPTAWTAKQLVTIDALAPGRLKLGVGVGGEFPYEFEAAGVPVSERGKRLDQGLDELPALLDGSGPLAPAISTKPPIYVGGRGEPALKRAEKYGEFWLPMWLSPDKLAQRAEGRQVKLATLVLVHVDDNHATAREQAELHVKGQYGMELEKIERWAGIGSAEKIAEQLSAYTEVGVEEFILMPLGTDPLTQIDRLAQVKESLACVYS